MKDLRQLLEERSGNVNESITKLSNIESYAESWVKEYDPAYFKEILYSIVKGMHRGAEDNKKYYKEDEGLIIDSLNLLDEIHELIEKHK